MLNTYLVYVNILNTGIAGPGIFGISTCLLARRVILVPAFNPVKRNQEIKIQLNISVHFNVIYTLLGSIGTTCLMFF